MGNVVKVMKTHNFDWAIDEGTPMMSLGKKDNLGVHTQIIEDRHTPVATLGSTLAIKFH